jgi:hypothetical protein
MNVGALRATPFFRAKLLFTFSTFHFLYFCRVQIILTMNSCQVQENVLPAHKQKREVNFIEKQYNHVFGKKEVYTDNEIFVFNAMRSVQKILERYEN